MLVLARRKGQSIIIGKDIRIYVLEMTGDIVRLGIDAPPQLEIFREELYKELHDENTRSITSSGKVMSLLKKNMIKNKNLK